MSMFLDRYVNIFVYSNSYIINEIRRPFAYEEF